MFNLSQHKGSILLGVCGSTAVLLLIVVNQENTVLRRVHELEQKSVASAASAREPQAELKTILADNKAQILELQKRLDVLLNGMERESGSQTVDALVENKRKADAEALVATLGKQPNAEDLARTLTDIDNWVAADGEIEKLSAFKNQLTSQLRQLVKEQVISLQDSALKADRSTEAMETHSQAARTLALYPMAQEKEVINEMRMLSARQNDVAVRIEAVRRQRYNAWALSRVDATIKGINNIASSFKSSDNPKTIELTVVNLGEIDPMLLEPMTTQLYTYAIELAKQNVTSEQQLELAKKMLDPNIKRKTLGDDL